MENEKFEGSPLAEIATLLVAVRNATILSGIALAGGGAANERAADALVALDELAVKYGLLKPVRLST
jgi:hypothetical protein